MFGWVKEVSGLNELRIDRWTQALGIRSAIAAVERMYQVVLVIDRPDVAFTAKGPEAACYRQAEVRREPARGHRVRVARWTNPGAAPQQHDSLKKPLFLARYVAEDRRDLPRVH